MDIEKMLAELRAEHQAVEEAIVMLERLAHGSYRRRGRPPAWLAEARAHAAVEEKAPAKRAASPKQHSS